MMKRIHVLLSVLLTLGACSHAAPEGQENTETPEGPTPSGPYRMELTLSSYNVLGVESKAAWAPRKEPIHAIVVREDHDPDVISFQECAADPMRSDLQTMFADTYDFHVISISGASPALVAWKRDRFSLVSGGAFDMAPGSEFTASRYAHWVRLREKESGRDFLMYDIHLKTNGTVSYQQLCYDSIQLLVPNVNARAKTYGDIPAVICGDFNNYLNTIDGGVISGPAACKALGFTDAATATTDKKNFYYKTSGTDMTGKAVKWSSKDSRIDFIFLAPGIEVSSYQTVIDFVDGSDINLHTPVPSDHHPVSARLVLQYE